MSEQINILIFVLDDQKQELDLIKRSFDKNGITNYNLYDSSEVFLNEFNEDVHLTIVDYLLVSGESGMDVVKKINRINPLCHNIIVSGYANADTVIEFFRNGVSDFVSKNNEDYLDDMVEAVKRALPSIQRRVDIAKKWRLQT